MSRFGSRVGARGFIGRQSPKLLGRESMSYRNQCLHRPPTVLIDSEQLDEGSSSRAAAVAHQRLRRGQSDLKIGVPQGGIQHLTGASMAHPTEYPHRGSSLSYGRGPDRPADRRGVRIGPQGERRQRVRK